MKPADLILDLLRTYGNRGTSTRNIMETAALFGIKDNLIRVTLSRLANRGVVENSARGHYRLAEGSDPVNDFAEEWRLGESRCDTWQDHAFVCITLQQATDRDRWCLAATGFVNLYPYLWVRPDNLRRHGRDLKNWLVQLGLNPQAFIMQAAQLDVETRQLVSHAYDTELLAYECKQMQERLLQSLTALTKLGTAEAKAESFKLGGEAIQLLAKDPYLPGEIMTNGPRQQLWQTLLKYDEVGRNIWTATEDAEQENSSHAVPATMPAAVATYV